MLRAFIALCAAVSSSAALAAYECGEPTWAQEPVITNNVLNGTIRSECTFDAVAGGTLAALADSEETALVESFDEVHSGPNATTIEDLAGFTYDATYTLKSTLANLTVRGDVLVAANEARFQQSSVSRSVTGTGFGKWVRGMSVVANITETDSGYRVVFESAATVEKPTLMTAKQFLNFVVKNATDEMKARQPERIEAYQKVL